MMPFRYSARLIVGLGCPASENAALAPSTAPPGTSLSTYPGTAPPPAPQGPDEPSTCTQSVRLPPTASNSPVAFETITRPVAYPGPSVGRELRSATRPTTSLSCIGPPLPESRFDGVEMRTSRTRSRLLLGGTAHVSSNCTLPSLL